MDNSIHRIVYMSENRIDSHGHDAPHGEIDTILAASRRNNAAADVTGALMFNNGRFAQVLEGPLDSVQTVFERIQCDLRHCNVVVLMFEKTDQRQFSKWSMGYVGSNSRALETFAYITSESGFNPAELSGEDIYALLQEHLFEAERAGQAA